MCFRLGREGTRRKVRDDRARDLLSLADCARNVFPRFPLESLLRNRAISINFCDRSILDDSDGHIWTFITFDVNCTRYCPFQFDVTLQVAVYQAVALIP